MLALAGLLRRLDFHLHAYDQTRYAITETWYTIFSIGVIVTTTGSVGGTRTGVHILLYVG
jgi:hypothetical protein